MKKDNSPQSVLQNKLYEKKVKNMLSLDQLSDLIKVPQSTLQKFLAKGILPTKHLSKVEKFVAEPKKKTTEKKETKKLVAKKTPSVKTETPLVQGLRATIKEIHKANDGLAKAVVSKDSKITKLELELANKTSFFQENIRDKIDKIDEIRHLLHEKNVELLNLESANKTQEKLHSATRKDLNVAVNNLKSFKKTWFGYYKKVKS